jgi:hypothetical protein
MGADVNLLDSGCCGMAGSFGFEKHKYDVSQRVFEHELRGHIENASQDTILVADGFSCKTQIKQSSGREALHLAQVLQLALRGDQHGHQSGKLPRNDGYMREWIAAGTAAILLGGALAWRGGKLWRNNA